MSVEAGELRIPVVWSQDCLLHEPGGEVWLGLREAGTEVPERATVILDTLRDAGAPVLPARRHEIADLHSVHHPASRPSAAPGPVPGPTGTCPFAGHR